MGVPSVAGIDLVPLVCAGSELDSKGVKRKTIGEQISELWKQQPSDFDSWGTPVADDGRKVAWLSPMPADVAVYLKSGFDSPFGVGCNLRFNYCKSKTFSKLVNQGSPKTTLARFEAQCIKAVSFEIHQHGKSKGHQFALKCFWVGMPQAALVAPNLEVNEGWLALFDA